MQCIMAIHVTGLISDSIHSKSFPTVLGPCILSPSSQGPCILTPTPLLHPSASSESHFCIISGSLLTVPAP